jgi:hypothetical protein
VFAISVWYTSSSVVRESGAAKPWHLQMRPSSNIPFPVFIRFLSGLGYKLSRTEKAAVFRHPSEGRIVFRAYADNELVDLGDLRTTRRFLDLRGLSSEDDFDAFFRDVSTPA